MSAAFLRQVHLLPCRAVAKIVCGGYCTIPPITSSQERMLPCISKSTLEVCQCLPMLPSFRQWLSKRIYTKCEMKVIWMIIGAKPFKSLASVIFSFIASLDRELPLSASSWSACSVIVCMKCFANNPHLQTYLEELYRTLWDPGL